MGGMPGWLVIGIFLLAGALAAPCQDALPEGPGNSASVAELPAETPAEVVAVVEDPAAVRRERLFFFWAIATGDTRAMCLALNAGMDPNCDVPDGAPSEFLAALPDERTRYYARAERGFTPLMLAAALGNLPHVEILLAAGADPNRKTKRHRTFALWIAGKYGHVEIMRRLMGLGEGDPARGHCIEVDLASQTAKLVRFGRVVAESPISSGRASHPTPTGTYVITDKYPMWKSTLYDAKMPHFLRLSCGDFGLHAGRLPGYPASHGCIRLPPDMARTFFQEAPVGTLVVIR